jgi:hypothetical protein
MYINMSAKMSTNMSVNMIVNISSNMGANMGTNMGVNMSVNTNTEPVEKYFVTIDKWQPRFMIFQYGSSSQDYRYYTLIS